VRSGLVERIEREAAAARAGHEAWVKIKVNSAVDEATIDALYRASQAGAKVDVVVRGICAIRPGVPGLSENIRVRSILGRFLEHSRIFAFANSVGPQIAEGPESGPEVFIGSADLMHRNLDRRVEALVRIADPGQVSELLDLLSDSMSGQTTSWHLGPDDTWERHVVDSDGDATADLQSVLVARHRRRPSRS
jgi:polyphosphate kinase